MVPGWLSTFLNLVSFEIIRRAFTDSALLPQPRQDFSDTKTPWLVVTVISLYSLFNMASYVAFEATFGTILFDELAVSAGAALPYWLASGCAMLAVGMHFKRLIRCGPRILVVICFAMTCISFILFVPFGDLNRAISKWRMGTGAILAYGFMTCANILVTATLSRALPPTLQGKWASFNQLAGQIGRTLGPLYGTWAYTTGQMLRPGTHFGANFFFLTWAVTAIGSLLLPVACMVPFFAVFDTPLTTLT